MRKLLVILSAVFMLFVTGCPNNVKFEPDLKNIKNFSNYSSIGIGKKEVEKARSARAAAEGEVSVLVGLNKYSDLIEELGFVSTDEEDIEEELTIYNYVDTDLFMFVQFSKGSSSNIFNNFDSPGSSKSSIFAISKSSGKIYNLENRLFSYHQECKDAVFCGNDYYHSLEQSAEMFDEENIYKLSEENELLQIEKYCTISLLSDGLRSIKADIYGNLMDINTGKLLTTTKEIRLYNNSWFVGYDGRFYNTYSDSSEMYQWLDENGDLQEIKYQNGNYTIQNREFSKDELIFIDNLDYYFYDATEKQIYKVSFEDSSKIRSKTSPFKNIYCTPIKYNNKIFYLNEINKVVCYDFADYSEKTANTSNFFADTITLTDTGLMCTGYKNGNETIVMVDIDTLEGSESNLRKRSISSVVYLTPIN